MNFSTVKTLLVTTFLAATLVARAAQPDSQDKVPKNFNEWTVAQLEAEMAYPTLVLTLRSQFWWMSAQTASICHMTR